MLDRAKLLHIQSDDSSSEQQQTHTPATKQAILKQKPNERKQFESCRLQKNIFMNPENQQLYVDPTMEKKKNVINFIKENTVCMEKKYKNQILQENQHEISEINKKTQNSEDIKVNSTLRDIKGMLQVCLDDDSQEQENKVQIDKDEQRSGKEEELQNISSSQQGDKFLFLHTIIKRGKTLSTSISRTKSGLNYFLPQLDMSFFDDFKHIMSCKKQVGTSNLYHFSSSKELFEEQFPPFCGKVKKQFLDHTFNIYESQQPYIVDKKQKQMGIVCSCRFREEAENIMFPKFYEIYIINEGVTYTNLQGIISKDQDKSLHEVYNIGRNRQKISYFRTRKPEFCKKTGSFRLNFNGRVTRPSVKNFILQDPKSGRQVLMFGKNGEDLFNMDISHPLTPFVGFAVMIPFFTSKLFS